MAGMNWDQMTPEERLVAEQAVLNIRELNKVCDAAADGTVLGTCETWALRNSLAPHQHHLNDAGRLANGQSSGSGQMEGACKNLIGRRLKQTGARRRVRRVRRQAGPCSLMDSHHWNSYWQTPQTQQSAPAPRPRLLRNESFLWEGNPDILLRPRRFPPWHSALSFSRSSSIILCEIHAPRRRS